MDIPIEDVLSGSPVVVVGKIDKVLRTEANGPDKDLLREVSSLVITAVLKDKTKKKLSIGSRLEIASNSPKSKLRMSKDIHYPIGKEGIWILEQRDGLWWATYPKDFQSLTKRGDITKHIATNASKAKVIN